MSESEFEASPETQQRPPTARFDHEPDAPGMPFPGTSFDPRSARPAALDPSIRPGQQPSGGFGANLRASGPTSSPWLPVPHGDPLGSLPTRPPERRVVKVPKDKKERQKTQKTLEKEAALKVVQQAYRANSGTSSYDPAESGSKQVETTKDATGQRVAQLLKLISERVREIGGGDEFESLWVDGTLIVAANDKDAIDRVVQSIASSSDLLDEKLVWRLLAAPRVWQYTAERDRHTRKKLTKVALGERGARWTDDRGGQDFAAYQEMEALLGAQLPNVKLYDEKGALEQLNTSKDQRTRVIFFHGTAIHAEQQLVRLLAKSSLSAASAMVRGTKRPCYGCYVAMRWAKESGACPGLDYTMKPGLLWVSAAKSAIDSVFDKHSGQRPRDYIDQMFLDFANCETWRSRVGDKDEADIDALSASSEDETEESRIPQSVRAGLAVPLRKVEPKTKKRQRATSDATPHATPDGADPDETGGRAQKVPRTRNRTSASGTGEPKASTATTTRKPPRRRPARIRPVVVRGVGGDDSDHADDEADLMDSTPSAATDPFQ
jgi:hypothetical protein